MFSWLQLISFLFFLFFFNHASCSKRDLFYISFSPNNCVHDLHDSHYKFSDNAPIVKVDHKDKDEVSSNASTPQSCHSRDRSYVGSSLQSKSLARSTSTDSFKRQRQKLPIKSERQVNLNMTFGDINTKFPNGLTLKDLLLLEGATPIDASRPCPWLNTSYHSLVKTKSKLETVCEQPGVFGNILKWLPREEQASISSTSKSMKSSFLEAARLGFYAKFPPLTNVLRDFQSVPEILKLKTSFSTLNSSYFLEKKPSDYLGNNNRDPDGVALQFLKEYVDYLAQNQPNSIAAYYKFINFIETARAMRFPGHAKFPSVLQILGNRHDHSRNCSFLMCVIFSATQTGNLSILRAIVRDHLKDDLGSRGGNLLLQNFVFNVDSRTNSPMHQAMKPGNIKTVQFFILELCANPHILQAYYWHSDKVDCPELPSILSHYLFPEHSLQVLQKLLQRQLLSLRRGSDGLRPVHLAIASGDEELVKEMLRLECEHVILGPLKLRTFFAGNLLAAVMNSQNIQVIRLILSKFRETLQNSMISETEIAGNEYTVMGIAIKQKRLQVVKVAIEMKFNIFPTVSMLVKKLPTLLDLAAAVKEESFAKILIEAFQEGPIPQHVREDIKCLPTMTDKLQTGDDFLQLLIIKNGPRLPLKISLQHQNFETFLTLARAVALQSLDGVILFEFLECFLVHLDSLGVEGIESSFGQFFPLSDDQNLLGGFANLHMKSMNAVEFIILKGGNKNLLKWLLTRLPGAFWSQSNAIGLTPIHLAICCGNHGAVQILLQAHPQLRNQVSGRGLSPIETIARLRVKTNAPEQIQLIDSMSKLFGSALNEGLD